MNLNPESPRDDNETSRELEKMKENMKRFRNDAQRAEEVLSQRGKAERLAQVGKGRSDIERAKETIATENTVARSLQGIDIPNLDGMPKLEDLSHPDDLTRVETLLADLKKGTPHLQWNIMENGGMDHLM